MADVTTLAYIDTTGYHFADYPAFLTWIQDSYKSIYGADVYLAPDSQDGQFLAILAKGFYDTAALGASVYNSFSPVSAQGTGLARNVKINGLNKRSATRSTVPLTLVGTTGTTITNGVANDTLNQKWVLPVTVTIPTGGTITVTGTAFDEGAVSAAIGTITQIYTPTLGWQTVNNASAATEGVAIETDAALRIRQAQSTANPSLTVLDGTIGGVANLEGVTDVRGYENDTESTDSNTLPAHSIAIIVAGGDNTEIAQEILLHKTPGTTTYGTTTVTVYDSHGMPLAIKFSRPTLEPIKARVTLAAGVGWSSAYADLIKQALVDTIGGFGIGNDVLITKLYAPAYLADTPAGGTYDIATIEIAKVGDSFGSINVPILYNEQPTAELANMSVVVT